MWPKLYHNRGSRTVLIPSGTIGVFVVIVFVASRSITDTTNTHNSQRIQYDSPQIYHDATALNHTASTVLNRRSIRSIH